MQQLNDCRTYSIVMPVYLFYRTQIDSVMYDMPNTSRHRCAAVCAAKHDTLHKRERYGYGAALVKRADFGLYLAAHGLSNEKGRSLRSKHINVGMAIRSAC